MLQELIDEFAACIYKLSVISLVPSSRILDNADNHARIGMLVFNIATLISFSSVAKNCS